MCPLLFSDVIYYGFNVIIIDARTLSDFLSAAFKASKKFVIYVFHLYAYCSIKSLQTKCVIHIEVLII